MYGIGKPVKPLVWVGSSLEDLKAMPGDVQDEFGYALHRAQIGDKHPKAKPLSGFGSAGVLEIVARHEGDAYRAIYTVRLVHAVYVLHCFKKKSNRGIQTPGHDMDLIRRRLLVAKETDDAQHE